MYFDETNKQWISADFYAFGVELKDEVLRLGRNIIPAGTVMVFTLLGKPYLMFQMLQDLDLSSAKNTTLMYYEKGSIVFLGSKVKFVPTLRFRYCRFPTEVELRLYERRATI